MLYCLCSALFDLEIRGVLNRFAWSQEREKKKSKLQQTFSTPLFFSGKRGTTLGKRRKKNDKLHLNDVRLAFTWALALLHTQCNIRCTHSCDSWSHKFFSFFFQAKKALEALFSLLCQYYGIFLSASRLCDLSREGENQFSIFDTEQRWIKNMP